MRTRSIRAGFTDADDAVVAADGADEGDCAHAATTSASAASKANSRTPVDTTEIAYKTLATSCVGKAMNKYQATTEWRLSCAQAGVWQQR